MTESSTGHYWIDNDSYWINDDGELRNTAHGGKPEMWLQAALQDEIKRHRWDYRLEQYNLTYIASIWERGHTVSLGQELLGKSAAEALGWALVKALEKDEAT